MIDNILWGFAGAADSLAELFGWDLSSSTASNISEAADSAEDLTDTAEESSQAVDDITDSSEEAKGSLAGFDKLNVLSSSDSSSSDSGTTSADTTASSASASDATAAVSSVESAVDSLSDKLTGTFKNLYEKSGFKSFISNIQKGINKVDWSKIGENCKTIFNNAVPIVQKAFEQMQKVGAASGDPEVVSPLSKLQGMIDGSSNGQDVTILSQILDYMKKLYEMFIIFKNNGGNTYEFTAELNGKDLFNEIIKQDKLYKRRHNGKSAFA